MWRRLRSCVMMTMSRVFHRLTSHCWRSLMSWMFESPGQQSRVGWFPASWQHPAVEGVAGKSWVTTIKQWHQLQLHRSLLSGGSFVLAQSTLVADVWLFFTSKTNYLGLLLPDDSSSGTSLPFSLFAESGNMTAAGREDVGHLLFVERHQNSSLLIPQSCFRRTALQDSTLR